MRGIPNMKVASPSDAAMFHDLMSLSLETDGPLAIRYPRGSSIGRHPGVEPAPVAIGKGRTVRESETADTAVLSVGPILKNVTAAADAAREKGVDIDIYDMIWVKPLDSELLSRIAAKHKRIVTVEDGVAAGGFGSAVQEWLSDNGYDLHVTRLGIPDSFIQHGSVAQLQRICGIDSDTILKTCIQS